MQQSDVLIVVLVFQYLLEPNTKVLKRLPLIKAETYLVKTQYAQTRGVTVIFLFTTHSSLANAMKVTALRMREVDYHG
jgi:hypothetical protein